ncbi:MAG: hypothetical protein ACI4TU_10920, partial [Candidatus Cryptobacteroides sp.]
MNVESFNRESGVTSFSTSCSVAEGIKVTNYGILWGTSANLKSYGLAKKLTFPADGNPVKFELPDLELGKQYYICQHFTDTDVTVYGNAEQFKVCTRPFVTKRGVIWGTSAYLTVSMPTKTVNASGIGSFSSSITDLIPNTSYYVCSYATNSIGTTYGEVKFFRTKEEDYSSATDLSSSESANCYIVSSGGKYKFKTVKGNSSTSVGNVASCEVLWGSFGASTIPSQGFLQTPDRCSPLLVIPGKCYLFIDFIQTQIRKHTDLSDNTNLPEHVAKILLIIRNSYSKMQSCFCGS